MIRFRDDIGRKLKSKRFAEGYRQELHVARLALEIAQAREKQGMTQSTLASRARITQQQLSKVENARACKLETVMKVAEALGMELTLRPRAAQVRRTGSRRRRAPGSPKRRVDAPQGSGF